VAAGKLSPPRRWSLAAWEAVSAAIARRPRAALVHSALKVGTGDGALYTIEMMPVFSGEPSPPAMTGPVGFRWAGRSRFFRYQLRVDRDQPLPDEGWTLSVTRLTTDGAVAGRVIALAPEVPRFTWGRRAPRTTEMWTSDSAIAWLLSTAGVDLAGASLPEGSRAPGWVAGLQVAGVRAR